MHVLSESGIMSVELHFITLRPLGRSPNCASRVSHVLIEDDGVRYEAD